MSKFEKKRGKFKKIISILAVFMVMISVAPKVQADVSWSGSGTKEDPWIITTPQELDHIRDYLGSASTGKFFKLGNDIDLSSYLSTGGEGYSKWADSGWLPIGSNIDTEQFTGNFDGQGYRITGLSINRPYEGYIGLFSVIGEGGVVSNVGLESVDIIGNNYTGGLAGAAIGLISNSYVTGKVKGENYTGGLLGAHLDAVGSGFSTPFVFASDSMGTFRFVNKLGMRLPHYNKLYTMPNDYVELEPEILQPKDGEYSINITNEFNEISYLDQILLLAFDHKAGYMPALSFIQQDQENNEDALIKLVSTKPKPVASVKELSGADCTAAISSRGDNQWTSGGSKETNYNNPIEIDLGDLSGADQINLLLAGVTDSNLLKESGWEEKGSDIHIMEQMVQVPDENGNWVDAYKQEELNRPLSTTSLNFIDLTDKFVSNDYRVRIGFSLVKWDYIAVDTSTPPEAVKTVLQPETANLHFRGFSLIDKTTYPYWTFDYKKVSLIPEELYAYQSGSFTRYGDVTSLMQKRDNQFVIMHYGDELSLKFGYTEPKLGMERSFVLYGSVWYKHANEETGRTVDPLPFIGMESYPYNNPNIFPEKNYVQEWNTRHYISQGGSGNTIRESYSTVDVVGVDYVGGLVGQLKNKDIYDSYSMGSVKGTNYVGGLAGSNEELGKITNSYASGSVSGETKVGGLVGENSGTVIGSFYDREIASQSDIGKGEPKTTAEMQDKTTFTGANWDFSTKPVWKIDQGGYPYFPRHTAHTYTVSFDSQGGSEVASVDNIAQGSKITAPTIPTKIGYTFGGWYGDTDYNNNWNFDTDVVTESITLYAKWNANTYTVSFDSNGGSTVEDIKNVVEGSKVTAPANPTKAGHTFAGWHKEAACTNAWDFDKDTITANTTLYAKWTENSPDTYTVSFNTQGGSTVSDIPNLISGTKITEPAAPIHSGYTFGGWYKEAACTNVWDFDKDTVTADTTLYAKWTENAPDTYTVSFNTQGGSTVSDIPNVVSGSAITVTTVPTRSGYTFGGWYKEAVCTNAWDFDKDTVTADTTLYAKWTENAPDTYSVSFNTQGGNIVSDIPNVVSGSAIIVTTVPTRSGYTFAGWYKEAACTNAWDFDKDTVTTNTTLYAKWTENAPDTYTISFNAQGGSTVSDIPNVISGNKITVPTAPTRAGYTFAGWYKEAICTNAWDFDKDTVAADTTLYAKWTENAPDTYTVSFNAQGGSTVSDIPNVISGNKITVPAAPTRSGYTFAGWYKEAACTNAWDFGTDTVTADTTLYAKWTENAPDTYTVSFHTQGGSTVSDIPNVVSGNKITVPTVPTRSGYTFAGWYKEAACTHAWDFGTDTVTADTTLYAKWTINGSSNNNDVIIPPASSSDVEEIVIPVKQGDTDSTVTQITIKRSKDANGQKIDTVTYQKNKAVDTVKELQKAGKNTARLVIPDTGADVPETKIILPSDTIKELSEGNINIQIDTKNVKVDISRDTLGKINQDSEDDDLYFRLIPVKETVDKKELEDRAVLEVEVINKNAGNTTILGNPVTIETNMHSTEADITLPLTGIVIPSDSSKRSALLQQLAVYIEHSDGDKELVQGELVEYGDGVYGIKFHIKKFSTFTLVKTDAFLKSADNSLLKVITPTKAVLKGTTITATVATKVDSMIVRVKVSDKAVWELYKDKAATKVIKDNKMSLKTGANIAYIKVTSEDGTAKIYKLTITRSKASEALLTKVSVPKDAKINGKTITATVAYKTASLTVKAAVSNKAVWKLYGDKACTKLLTDNKLTLKEGVTTAYIKVVAENGKSSNVYTLKITRKAPPKKQYDAHVKLGVIGSKTYAEKVVKIFEQDYAAVNIVIKPEGKYYRVTMDFTDKTAAKKACEDMIIRKYIVNYYFY